MRTFLVIGTLLFVAFAPPLAAADDPDGPPSVPIHSFKVCTAQDQCIVLLTNRGGQDDICVGICN